jgi:hypothetical protein
MDDNYIEIPADVRRWLNRQPGYDGIHVKANTFTNQEKWLLGRTDAQIIDYARSEPFWTCPLFHGKCPQAGKTCGGGDNKKRDEQACWELFRKWAITPIEPTKIKGENHNGYNEKRRGFNQFAGN